MLPNQPEFKIGKTKIGGNNPVFIVAEIGINHDGNFDQAIKLIDSAKLAKCSAVKFQLFTAETMYAGHAGKLKTPSGESFDIRTVINKDKLPPEWIPKLKRYANKNGLEFFSTVCSEEDVDAINKFHPDAYKIASYEITHLPLFHYVAKQKKTVIFSTACSTLQEVADAVDVFKAEKNKNVALMHCVGKYGASLKDLNLNVIKTLKLAFPNHVIGYSDHSSEPEDGPVAAVTLGAKIIEKHITLDRNLPGPDHSFALNPKELKQMVTAIRNTEKLMKANRKVKINPVVFGNSERKTYPVEEYVREFAYRSIFTTKPVKKGEKLTRNNIRVLRPGINKRGLDPKFYDLVLNHKTNKALKEAESIKWQDLLG